ncbi:Protein kinase gsk3 [Apiospora arundinis]
MSQPPYAYGQYPGQQSQQNYPYMPNTNQPPGLSYGAMPQVPNHAFITGHFAATNNSFEQNSSRIPGLGMGGGFPSSVAAPTYPVANDALWRPGNVTIPKGPHVPTDLRPQKASQQQSDLQASVSADATQFDGHSAQTTGNQEVLEEGELSEGEFEDLYEPRHSTSALNAKSAQASRPPSTAIDNQGSAGDADESSIYDTGSKDDEEYSPGEYGGSEAMRVWDRSGSYSPYLSPREVHKEAPTIARAPPRTEPYISNSEPAHSSTTQHTSTTHKPIDFGTPSGNRSNLAQPQLASTMPYKSVTEAKKKAQEAILGLWPLKVRYQNYIDEGLDPEVVKTLFADLGLDVPVQKPSKPSLPTAKSSSQNHQKSAPQTSPKKVNSPTIPAPTSDHSVSKTNGAPSVNMADKKAEERKDKIARMLAEKKQKSAAAHDTTKTTPSISPVTAAVTASKPVEPSPAQLKAKTKAENTLKLQQKLAALRKAQEEAEAKRKQEQIATQQTSANVASGVQSDTSALGSGATATPQRSKQNSPKADLPAGSPATKVPGLALSSLSQPTAPTRTLKRPVASDFDGYSSSNSMLKRTRTQERLIIDVSEDEDEDDDEDEDIEMDIGSPIDGPPGAAIQTIGGGTPNRPNSLGTFPPLSSAPTWRHKSSPVQTPPEHNHKLDHLHRQIEEAKKRIAEAEAKKAAKKPNGSVTPVTTASPAPTSGSSLKLPKLSELAKATQRAKNERRERITSYHLPIIDAALKEKQERLKQLQMEAAQVELEVQARLEERNKLSAEMDALKDIDVDVFSSTVPSPLPTPDQSFADDYRQPQSAAQEPVISTDIASSELPETGTTQEPAFALVPGNINTPQAPLTKEVESQPETIEDPASSSEKSDMDIDSSDSSSDEGEDMNIEPIEAEETAAPSLIRQNSLPSAEQAVPNTEGTLRGSSSEVAEEKEVNESDMGIPLADSQPQTAIEVANDADASLQASVADLSADEEDPYEPVLGQISSTDKIQGSDEEEGEVPDDDPYEPSPAQPVEAASEPTAQATSGEAEEQATTLSSKDLLSYQSPLRFFRAYRFHPKYMDEVPGGLRSMTYSSRVDCNTPLCPSSDEKKSCPNGPSCQYQHFSDMVASDSDIIASLGSVDSYNGEQKGRFIDGLRKVLSDLKSDSSRVKNFDSITSAILQYRREFFGGDDTKVLPLEGVAI